MDTPPQPELRQSEKGNMLFMILIAVVLIGLLTAAIQYTSRPESSNIDKETLIIRASEVQRYASELERAVMFTMQNGISEADIRFAHPDAHSEYGDLSADPDPSDQVFHRDGGGANYRAPPADINDGSAWEFYGGSHAPGTGSSRSDLMAVLPYVTPQFCDKINELNGQTGSPADTGATAPSGNNPGTCVHGTALVRFDDARQFYTTVNTMDETSFEQDPEAGAARTALQACVQCGLDTNAANGTADEYHFYHVLMAR